MWIERTGYHAHPGKAAEVLAQRRRACAVRAHIGLATGDIYVKHEGDGPDVRWECRFPTAQAHADDLAARAASPAFEAVRAGMRALIARFERHVEQRDTVSALASGMVHTNLHGLPIAAQEMSFRSGAHDLKGYLTLPPGPGPFPCLMLNHGSGIAQGTLDVSRPGTAALLASWGIASFLTHRHGYGNSTGPDWRSEASAPVGTAEYAAQLSARLDRESDDVLAATALVAALPEVAADHIGVMGSSFGGVNTLLAAAKSRQYRCAVEFAGAAMNWDRAPELRALLIAAARCLTTPIFFIQAANDYSIRPTVELAEALVGTDVLVQSRVYPAFGITAMEGHLFERDGSRIWGDDVRRFLERYL